MRALLTWRTPLAAVLLAVVLGACGEGGAPPSSAPPGSAGPDTAAAESLPEQGTPDTTPLGPIPAAPVARPRMVQSALPVASLTVDTLYDTTRKAGYVIVKSAERRTAVTVRMLAPDTIQRPPPPAIVTYGVPLGAYALARKVAPFTVRVEGVNPRNIVSEIARARQDTVKLVLVLTGGAHSEARPGDYLERQCPGYAPSCAPADSVWMFSLPNYIARLDEYYADPVIRAAIELGVRDSVILSNIAMDEPNVSGHGDGNTWGPYGTMTKARVDTLCLEIHKRFPTLATGPSHRPDWDGAHAYRECDNLVTSYSSRLGTLAAFRQAAQQLAARDGHQILYSFNSPNGGPQDADGNRGPWDCPPEKVLGLTKPNCAMTPSLIVSVVAALAPVSCGAVVTWRYDARLYPYQQPGFAAAVQSGKALVWQSCRRRTG